MDIGSLLILFALVLLVGLFVARPILDREGSRSVSQEEHEVSALLAERDRTINALHELDFDFELGKIPEEDYPAQRAVMLQHGAEILRKLDSFEPQASEEGILSHPSAEDRMEEAIRRRRKIQSLAPAAAAVTANGENGNPQPDDDLEAKIAQRRRARQGKSAGFCHHCGSPLQQTDRFCPRCGEKN